MQIICVHEGESDKYYLKRVLEHYEKNLNKNRGYYKFSYITMDGKHKYKENKIKKKIEEKIRRYEDSKNSIVIYIIDTDKINTASEDKEFFSELKEYVISMKYKLIYFNSCIEEVLNQDFYKNFNENEKIKKARIYSVEKFSSISKEILQSENYQRKGSSNLDLVFSEIFA